MRANDVILVYLPHIKDNTANQKPGKQSILNISASFWRSLLFISY